MNHFFEIHYYNRSKCLEHIEEAKKKIEEAKKKLEESNKDNIEESNRSKIEGENRQNTAEAAPLHSILITNYQKEYLIGFNRDDSKTLQNLTFLIALLQNGTLYSKEGLIDQVRERIARLSRIAFKDCMREIGRNKGLDPGGNIWRIINKLFIEKKYKFKECYESIEACDRDIRNIVYKTIISEGLFTIYCDLNTMNPDLKSKLMKFCIPVAILPWSAKFHSSLIIGRLDNIF